MNSSLRFFPRRRGVVAGSFLIGLLSTALVADAAGSWRVRQVSARSLTNGYAVEPLASDALRPGERAFLTKAIETSRLQLRLAEIGVSQATNSAVRSHAQQLVADYR